MAVRSSDLFGIPTNIHHEHRHPSFRLRCLCSRPHPQIVEQLERMGIPTGNWMGSIFRGSWTDTGIRRRSARVSNHAREIKVWRFTPHTCS